MCLTIYKNKEKKTIDDIIRIAKKDIIVYKRLYIKVDKKIITPHQEYHVNLNGDFLIAEKFTIGVNNSHYLTINKGIHSYNNLNYAVQTCDDREIIVKSIIPEGTPYIESNYETVSLILIIPPIDVESIIHKGRFL